jgi:pantothenate kinase-related protein Tda10
MKDMLNQIKASPEDAKTQFEQSEMNGGLVKPLLIGVVGGTASGKTSLCKRIGEAMPGNISMMSLDNFYRGLS